MQSSFSVLGLNSQWSCLATRIPVDLIPSFKFNVAAKLDDLFSEPICKYIKAPKFQDPLLFICCCAEFISVTYGETTKSFDLNLTFEMVESSHGALP